jgi:hypothetical protein
MKTPEEEARSLGWKPKEDWKGPPDDWKDAEAFLEFGEKNASFANKRADQKIKELKDDFDARIAAIERTSQSALDAVQKQAEAERANLLAELNAKKKEAIADNDLEKLEKVREQIEEVKEAEPSPEDKRVASEFKKAHSFWQNKDWVVQNFADGAAGKLVNRGLTSQEFFAELDRQIREAFPEKFGKPKARSSVEADSPMAESGGDKDYTDLPPEAKKACDELYQRVQKAYPTKKAWVEHYCKEYFGA